MNQTAPVTDFPLEKIHAANRQAKILFASMGSSLIAYFVVSRFLPDRPPIANAGILQIVFLVVALATVAAATAVKGILLRPVPPGPEARIEKLRVAAVVMAAFSEFPAILGFVLTFLTGQDRGFGGLLGVSAYMLIRHFPRREAWELYVRRGGDAR